MRGTLLRPHSGWRNAWIIPAYAGNTRTPTEPATSSRDHPRVCGEHAVREDEIAFRRGSSPRMRGTPVASVTIRSMAGIIPAYAGNTHVWPTRPASDRDHPRVCGEHSALCISSSISWGSSPRMRGTQCLMHFVLHLLGIIPAYAGNTTRKGVLRHGIWDHPRVCGEHIVECCQVFLRWGSSPRMRGTRAAPKGTTPWTGIIPAYAGNTGYDAPGCISRWDHPRVCGEHSRCSLVFPFREGSSPRMRGTRS